MRHFSRSASVSSWRRGPDGTRYRFHFSPFFCLSTKEKPGEDRNRFPSPQESMCVRMIVSSGNGSRVKTAGLRAPWDWQLNQVSRGGLYTGTLVWTERLAKSSSIPPPLRKRSVLKRDQQLKAPFLVYRSPNFPGLVGQVNNTHPQTTPPTKK